MEIAIVGLPQSGKSTLFEIMTGIKPSPSSAEPFTKGLAKVPDERFERLVEIFKPEKITPAAIPFIDLNIRGEDAWDKARALIRNCDAILHVVDAFTEDSLDRIAASYGKLRDEMIISDMVTAEKRLEKLRKIPNTSKTPEDKLHSELFPKMLKCLEDGHRLRTLDIPDDVMPSLMGFAFLTIKPELVVLNISEENSIDAEGMTARLSLSTPAISICCRIEAEISTLPPSERYEFLDSMGIEEAAFEKIIRTAFSLLGCIYYFTVGEDEVRAWVISDGDTAPRAAAAIHKDFERGFIKAEVAGYDDFIASGADLKATKAAGRLRLEGKDYIVKDGDIISFRFNV
jgi:GTP-binding protein YchF